LRSVDGGVLYSGEVITERDASFDESSDDVGSFVLLEVSMMFVCTQWTADRDKRITSLYARMV